MTPEQARRIVAASGLRAHVPEQPKNTISTSEIARALGIRNSSVIGDLRKHSFKPIKLKKVGSPLLWTREAFEYIKARHNKITLPLPDGVDWITTKEAMAITDRSQPWLCKHAHSVRRLVNGRPICYYDKKEIINLAKSWLKLK